MAENNIKVSAAMINVLTSKTNHLLLNSQIEWSSLGSTKIRRCIFGNARLPMHKYHPLAQRVILQTWLNPDRGVYISTSYGSIDRRISKKPLLPLNELGNCCAMLYFARNSIGTPDCNSLCLLCAPVNFTQPSYAMAIYGTTTPILSSNCFKE